VWDNNMLMRLMNHIYTKSVGFLILQVEKK
jgi:hypothetical protein